MFQDKTNQMEPEVNSTNSLIGNLTIVDQRDLPPELLKDLQEYGLAAVMQVISQHKQAQKKGQPLKIITNARFTRHAQ